MARYNTTSGLREEFTCGGGMASREQADLALQAHHERLLENPNVAYISAVARNDGETDGEFVIEVGLIEKELEIDADAAMDEADLHTLHGFPRIQGRLAIPSRGAVSAADASRYEPTVEVRVVVCGDVDINSKKENR